MDPMPPVAERCRTGEYRVVRKAVKVTADRSQDSVIVGELQQGTTVEVLEVTEQGKRVRAQIADPAGWLTLEDGGRVHAAPTQLGEYRVLLGNLRVRADSSRYSAHVGGVSEGSLVHVLEVAVVLEEHTVFGRILEPAGWITLVSLRNGLREAVPTKVPYVLTVHLSDRQEDGTTIVCCTNMSGEEVANASAILAHPASELRTALAREFPGEHIHLILPDGSVLADDMVLGDQLGCGQSESNGDGAPINREAEFLRSPRPGAARSLELFQSFDSGGRGTITVEDMRVVFLDLGVSEADLDAVFAEADTNGDGVLDYQEFLRWLDNEE